MNRLQHATSPYLRQHADNPVDWYEWGEEALKLAQAEDKPIILSIGYSACHWCHVMAHESFEDPATAEIMNRDFVNIKVDREERPDLDDIYMQATLMFTRGHGGWPMTVFLTPTGKPFHAGTYFPKEPRYGMPSFKQVLAAVLDAYRNRRKDVEEISSEVTEGLQREALQIGGEDGDLNVGLLDAAYEGVVKGFDPIHGGLSRGSPKFPSPMGLEFLLRTYAHTGASKALEAATFSLNKMARGGIYDQLGGGFHRYSVDERWLVPHFEKMLYDNAQLSRVYLHAWQATGDHFFKRIATEIYDYILREMTDPQGGFYSTTDADSEGEEGKFFVWSTEEIRDLLEPDEARTALLYWGVTDEGNFEGHNILNVHLDDEVAASRLGMNQDTMHNFLNAARDKLFAHRTQRIHPGLDDKILTAWNGMMLASLSEGARILGREDYKIAAIRNAEFILKNLRKDGRLLRSFKDGQAHLNGYLEDYANLIDGLIQLYQATFDPRYFTEAQNLADIVLKHFVAPDGGFFDTSDDHEALIARPRNLQDNATPSGNSLMAKVLLQLSAYTGEARYEDSARAILRQLLAAMRQYPGAFGETLSAADLLIRGISEVAIIGNSGDAQSLLSAVNSSYRPNVVLAYSPDSAGENAIPALLASRTLVDGKPAAYVCRRFVCQRPVTDAESLNTQLAG